MNLRQIETFVTLAKQKNFSRTAKTLYLTQPTVSAHIAALEEELGVTLFDRQSKTVEMTPEGRKIYLMAREMVELSEKISGTFGKEEKEKDADEILIATSTLPAQYLVPQILVAFSKKHPKTTFRVSDTDSEGVIRAVQDHTIDIGFTGTVLDKKTCVYIPFFQDELVIITPPTAHYKALLESEKSCAWIRKEPVIVREEGSGTRKEAARLLKREHIDEKDLNIVATITSPETIVLSVKGGVGVSVISRLVAARAIASGDVLAFPLTKRGKGRSIHLVYNGKYPLSQSAKQMIDVVKKMYKI